MTNSKPAGAIRGPVSSCLHCDRIREEVLTPAGWTSEVRNDDKEESATIEVYKGSMHALGTTRRPSITFVIDRHSPTIFVTSQSISQGGGQGKFPLDEVTEEFVQATVLKFFQRLTSEG